MGVNKNKLTSINLLIIIIMAKLYTVVFNSNFI